MRPWPFPSAGLDAAGRAAARRALARGGGRLAACLRAGLAFGRPPGSLALRFRFGLRSLGHDALPSRSSLMRSRIDKLDGERGKATQQCSAGVGAVPAAH